MEPPVKNIKDTGAMLLAESIEGYTRELRRETAQREDEVAQRTENLPQTHIAKALALVEEHFGDNEDFYFSCVQFFLDASKAYVYIILGKKRRNILWKKSIENAGF